MSRHLSRITMVVFSILLSLLWSNAQVSAQEPAQPEVTQGPQLKEWGDTFDGNKLDETKWERYTFEGGSGGKFEIKDGELRMRAVDGSRAGVRSREEFSSERFIVEGTIAKVGRESGGNRGVAILTVLFDGSGRNRIEWLLSSEGILEAWVMIEGRGERFDNRKTGTKVKNPTLSIARKGDDYFFAGNGEVILQKNIRNLPRAFRVMLYGFGSSENNWDSVRVVTAKPAGK